MRKQQFSLEETKGAKDSIGFSSERGGQVTIALIDNEGLTPIETGA